MGNTSNDVDAIDLTLTSSPEPEQRPQQRQLHTQNNIKKEPWPYSVGVGSNSGRVRHPGSAGRSNVVQQSTNSVNPQHLRQIVYTSDEHALPFSGIIRGSGSWSCAAFDICQTGRKPPAERSGSRYEVGT
ncbi:hypothetical protein NX059_011645 [Plenodomus lindquistii]|nr:hypothetical protein NX059_011645 [Plenodomus lindquistii]